MSGPRTRVHPEKHKPRDFDRNGTDIPIGPPLIFGSLYHTGPFAQMVRATGMWSRGLGFDSLRRQGFRTVSLKKKPKGCKARGESTKSGHSSRTVHHPALDPKVGNKPTPRLPPIPRRNCLGAKSSGGMTKTNCRDTFRQENLEAWEIPEIPSRKGHFFYFIACTFLYIAPSRHAQVDVLLCLGDLLRLSALPFSEPFRCILRLPLLAAPSLAF